MQVRYGNLIFPDHSCLVTAETKSVLEANGRVFRVVQRVHVQCEIVTPAGTPDPTAYLVLQQQAIRLGLSVNYRELMLYDNSGRPTFIGLTNVGSLSGVRIVDGPHFPEGNDGELVTRRTCAFTAEATYPAGGAVSNVVLFQESLSTVGTGGPDIVWQESMNRPAQPVRAKNFTRCTAIQSGFAVGFLTYVNFPPPLWGLPYLKSDVVKEALGADVDGLALTNYKTRWQYRFEGDRPFVGLPHLFPL